MATTTKMAKALHDRLVRALCSKWGLDLDETAAVLTNCVSAARNGMPSHGVLGYWGILGSPKTGIKVGAVKPGARFREIGKPNDRIRRFDMNRMVGALGAMQVLELLAHDAKRNGTAEAVCTRATHYGYGGGHVQWAADLGKIGPLALPGNTGFIVETTCTAGMAEAVFPGCSEVVLGTDPVSRVFPLAWSGVRPHDLLVDFATTPMATGVVKIRQRQAMELAAAGREAEAANLLPPGCVVDSTGAPTTDPRRFFAHVPFGGHKGTAVNLGIAVTGLAIGNGPPQERGHFDRDGDEERGVTYTFKVTRLDALDTGTYAMGRDQLENLRFGLQRTFNLPGNGNLILAGQKEWESSQRSDAAGGYFYPGSEEPRIREMAAEMGVEIGAGELVAVD